MGDDIRDRLRDAAERRRAADAAARAALAELRDLCTRAVDEGLTPHAVHRITGVARTTLDAWLRDR